MMEYQIECRIERMTDSADKRFMRGDMSQEEYDAEMKRISEWADLMYSMSEAKND